MRPAVSTACLSGEAVAAAQHVGVVDNRMPLLTTMPANMMMPM